MSDEHYGGGHPITPGTGKLEGYGTWVGLDPCEDYMGPFYFKKEADDKVNCAFVAEAKHINGHDTTHGGILVTFADFAIFAIAQDSLDTGFGVTISLNSEFIAAGKLGDLIEAKGRVVRSTRSLVFVDGEIVVGDTTLLNFSGIIKK